jgi:hypothetical protein
MPSTPVAGTIDAACQDSARLSLMSRGEHKAGARPPSAGPPGAHSQRRAAHVCGRAPPGSLSGVQRGEERLHVQGAVACLVGETASAAVAVFQWGADGWLTQARAPGAQSGRPRARGAARVQHHDVELGSKAAAPSWPPALTKHVARVRVRRR